MPFDFKLDTVLELRRQKEKEHQRIVARIQQEVQRLQRQIQQTQISIIRQNRTLAADKLIGRLDLPYIANEKRFVGNLQLVIVQAMRKLAVAEKELAGARVNLLEAARARKAIERLREKQFARWQAQENRKESATLDELGMQVALRRMTEDEPWAR